MLSVVQDIITLLILGAILIGMFLCWQHYLEKIHDNPESPFLLLTPPPLLKLSIWTRANGRIAAIVMIAFTNWSAYISWVFWVQVCLLLWFFAGIVQLMMLDLDVSSITRTICTTLRWKLLSVSYLCPYQELRAT